MRYFTFKDRKTVKKSHLKYKEEADADEDGVEIKWIINRAK